jgi:hypothetical protein
VEVFLPASTRGRHRISAHRTHTNIQWDSNLRYQCWSGRRQFVPYTAWPLRSAAIKFTLRFMSRVHKFQWFSSSVNQEGFAVFHFSAFDLEYFSEALHGQYKNSDRCRTYGENIFGPIFVQIREIPISHAPYSITYIRVLLLLLLLHK